MVDSIHGPMRTCVPAWRILQSLLLGVALSMLVAVAMTPASNALAQMSAGRAAAPLAQVSPSAEPIAHDGSKDFDFLIGKWSTKKRRLLHPLSGDNTWETFESRMAVRHHARSARWRQEFSADDGRTWEVNGIAEHTRIES